MAYTCSRISLTQSDNLDHMDLQRLTHVLRGQLHPLSPPLALSLEYLMDYEAISSFYYLFATMQFTY